MWLGKEKAKYYVEDSEEDDAANLSPTKSQNSGGSASVAGSMFSSNKGAPNTNLFERGAFGGNTNIE